MSLDENVLVFPTVALANFGVQFKGFQKSVIKFNSIFFDNILEKLIFLPRFQVESDPDYKQVIPYGIISNASGKILSYERGQAGSEDRLKAKFSLGIGGHVSDIHYNTNSYFYVRSALLREISEELDDLVYQSPFISGYINDDSDDVGKVHFGIVFTIPTRVKKVKARDPAIHNPQFLSPDEIVKNLDIYENWSQLVIKGLL